MINTPTHFTNGSSSCFDWIFSSNMSYSTTGMEQLIYDKCHQMYGKLNFNIPLPTPYYRKIWNYKMASIAGIRF